MSKANHKQYNTARDVDQSEYRRYKVTRNYLVRQFDFTSDEKQLNAEAFKDAFAKLAESIQINASKYSYDEWVQIWKSEYKKLTNFQRKLKAYAGNKTQSEGSNSWQVYAPQRQREIQQLAQYANKLLNLRHIYKVMAREAMNKEYQLGK